jgi:hypothetical protein
VTPPGSRATEPFAVADELTCYYDRPGEPANVHLEVRLPGRVDQDLLRASVAALLDAEPGLLARRAGCGRWQRRYRWEFPARPDADPLLVSAYADQPELDRQRDAFVSLPPPLDSAPPFLLLLASGPYGDHLLLNAHHARFDGLACVRLLAELGAAYGRQAGGPPAAGRHHGPGAGGDGHPGAARHDLREPAGRPDRPGQGSRPGRPAWRLTGPVTRIAAGEGLDRRQAAPGYGACLLTCEGRAVADAARGAGASVNDVLITALMLTIADWNASRQPSARPATPGLIRITMPVGDRAQAGPGGAWANRSRLAAVAARPGAGTGAAALLAEVARQTAVAKRAQGPQVDAVSSMLTALPWPAVAKHRALRAALRIAGPALCDTALFSNLGQVAPPAFGDLTACEIWFSTSAHMPRGLSAGAVSSGGRLRITFRYRRALLSATDAVEFACRYAHALDQLLPAQVAL